MEASTQISKEDFGVQAICGGVGTPRDTPEVVCIAVKVRLSLQWGLQVVEYQL